MTTDLHHILGDVAMLILAVGVGALCLAGAYRIFKGS